VTIRDVATRAGVSHQTVSRVINNSERVNPETRALVEAAIAELGYQPNAIARFMSQGRTHTLACLSPNLTDYTLASLIEGAESEARRQGYFVISASAPDALTFAQLVRQLVDSQRTDGLLAINPYIDNRFDALPPDVPTMLIGAVARDQKYGSVALDEELAGRQATQYLLGLGHQHIAHITGPLVEDCSKERRLGYLSALHAAGIFPDPNIVLEGDWSATSGDAAVRRWLSAGVSFTALFAQNDRMAVGAIRALREAGLRVPEDISVMGFDDMPLASYFDPPLTTVRQDIFNIGCEAARQLIWSIENPAEPPRNLRIQAELVIRNSAIPRKEVP
jgi:LacI family repressor for deo operon, udp, cdd, tsx, nupC, and nupG